MRLFNVCVCCSSYRLAAFVALYLTLVGSSLQGDRENARQVVARVLLWGTGFACIAAAALITWRSSLPMLFVKDGAVVAQASLLLAVLAFFLVRSPAHGTT